MRLSDGSSIEDWNRPLVPVTVEVYEPEPDPQLVVLAKVLDALEGLREALSGLPAPMVHVDAPNMDAILAALANGTPPPSADAIAEAIASRIHAPVDNGPALAETVKEAFDKLDKRLQFPVTRPAAGGGSVSLANDPNRQLGVVTSITNPVTLSGSVTTTAPLTEQRLDFDVRTDGNPVYVGTADPGTLVGDPYWTVNKLTYDSSGRLTRKQTIASAIWNNRASLAW